MIEHKSMSDNNIDSQLMLVVWRHNIFIVKTNLLGNNNYRIPDGINDDVYMTHAYMLNPCRMLWKR